MKKYETRILNKIVPNAVTFVSSKDMDYYKAHFKRDNCILIPVGADDHKDVKQVKHQGKNIIFVGKMSYGPNVEAMEWFVRFVFPTVVKEIPDVHLYIVGKDPTEEIKAMQSDKITVTGMVDSVDDYYGLADLVVLPLKNGGGVKVKLLEAISYKKIVISTSTGVEGTEYAKGNIIPVNDSSEEFIKACIDRLNNPNSYINEVEEAYDYFYNNYSWDRIGALYTDALKNICCDS